MTIPTPLLAKFTAICPITDEFQEDFTSCSEPIHIPRKSKWLAYGEICRHALFLQRGLLYSSYEESNYTATTWFMKEYEFIISVESFFKQVPSKESITALEDSFGLGVSYDNVQKLITTHSCFHTIYTKSIEHYYILSEQRAFNLRKREAIERYRFLLENQPELIQRVPLNLVASYLCINIETLSRIRSRI